MEPQHICQRDYQPLFGKRDGAPPLPEERLEMELNSHAAIVIVSAPKRGGGRGGGRAGGCSPSLSSVGTERINSAQSGDWY